jgi:hypothetical protein
MACSGKSDISSGTRQFVQLAPEIKNHIFLSLKDLWFSSLWRIGDSPSMPRHRGSVFRAGVLALGGILSPRAE